MEDKVLFKARYLGGMGECQYEKNKVYDFKYGQLVHRYTNKKGWTPIKTVDEFKKHFGIYFELIEEQEEPLLNKFYDLLGIADMEEFKIDGESCLYRFNQLQTEFKLLIGDVWQNSCYSLIDFIDGKAKIIKLPPKPIFSDEEKEQLKHIYGLFGECWLGRDNDGSDELWIFKKKPFIENSYWTLKDALLGQEIKINKDILLSIRCQDAEPFQVDKQLIESFKE